MAEIHYPENRYCPECGMEYKVHCSQSSELPAGTLLCDKRYLVGKSLACGGCGITYIGYDLRLKRKIVIKETYYSGLSHRNTQNVSLEDPLQVIHDHGTLDEIMKKTQKECYCLSSAEKYTNIVNVYDFFSEHNTAYIITEYIDGDTLSDKVKKNGIYSWDELYSKVRPLMLSLSQLHKKGILHRDIKPDNIMIKHDYKNRDVFVLIDFGLARLSSKYNVPTKSALAFTPGYAPIEQRIMSREEGTYTDVYSLAATMYYALTGETPQCSDDDVLVVFPKLYYLKNSGKINSEVYGAFISALQPSSDKRCQTVEEFVNRLDGNSNSVNLEKSFYTPYDNEKKSSDTMFAAEYSDSYRSDSNKSYPNSGTNNYNVPNSTSGTQSEDQSNLSSSTKVEKVRETFSILSAFFCVLFVMITFVTVLDAFDILMVPDFISINDNTDEDQTSDVSSEPKEYDGYAYLGNYVGQNFDDVKKLLEDMGFSVTSRKNTHSDKPDGTILEQHFQADQSYKKGDTLNFVVARSAESLSPSHENILVSSSAEESQVSSSVIYIDDNSSSEYTEQSMSDEDTYYDDSDFVITPNIPNGLENSHTHPIFKYSSVSTYLPASGGYTFDKDNVLHDDGTCWCENVPGVGVGEYFEFYTPSEQVVSQCILINGYNQNETTFRNNGRMTVVTFSFSDGTVLNYNIDPDIMGQQIFFFPREIYTTFIRITIADAVGGDKYEDTCISFILPG